MTPSLLATLRAAGEAATKGPWDRVMHEDWWEVVAPGEPSYICADPNGRAGSCDDAAFIVLARNHWGELLDEIERLRRDLENAEIRREHAEKRAREYLLEWQADPNSRADVLEAAIDEQEEGGHG